MDKKPYTRKIKAYNNNNHNQSQINNSAMKERLNILSKLRLNGNTIKNYNKKKLSNSIIGNKNNEATLENKESEDFVPFYNKQNININLDNKINNIEFAMSDLNKDISSMTQTNFWSNPKFASRNYSINSYADKQVLDNNFLKSMKNIPISQSSNELLADINGLLHNDDQLNQKNSSNTSRIKDDYINFLKKQVEDTSKNSKKHETNNKELEQKCNALIQDNQLLNQTLNEKMDKLNKIIQENLNIKTDLDKAILINQKNEQKMTFYEEQLKLFKSNNDNYQKIIKELKEQNKQLNLNMAKFKNTSEEDKKKAEEKYKNDIEEMKKNLENKIQTDDKNYESKIKTLSEENKTLKEKNAELEKELKNKDNIIQLMYKDNEKLSNQNNLNVIQIEQNTKQINDLKTILKHKENLINNLKAKEIEKEKAFFNNSNSSLKFENSEYISENITKLITDNEENRMKIDYLHDKMKAIDEIEKRYTEIVRGKKSGGTVPHKFYVNINTDINLKTPRQRKYNNKNHKFYTSINNKSEFKKKLEKKEIELNKLKNTLKKHLVSSSLPNHGNDSNVNKKDFKIRKNMIIREIKDFKENKGKNQLRKEVEDKNMKENNFKNKSVIIREIKQENKPKERENRINGSYKGRRLYYKKELTKPQAFEEFENQFQNDKDSEASNDEIKDTIREIDRMKILTYRPNTFNYSDEEIIIDRKTQNRSRNNISYYLYGIDRNDFFHIFDIGNKVWLEKRKILELSLDNKSDSFKKDYQYEGTILYNTLEGVYILTGENTDILYYFNSKKNSLSRICQFNNGHNNGSIMYDEYDRCLYVFGGKSINSCEYYSFSDKRVYSLPDLITDRANASFIMSNNKIFGFFGFSYDEDSYAKTIEYIDIKKKDRWVELNNIKFLKNNIKFDIESASTMYYKQNMNKILIYSGIQGEDEDFVTDYYLIYDVKNNTIDKIRKWDICQYKYMGQMWKDYESKDNDLKGFHFAKNSRFITIPQNCVPEGYDEDDIIDVLIDYKNNVHFITQEKQQIDIYRGEI